MLMYHDNLFPFLLANEGWRCINWSLWGHWLTGQGMWHMVYTALSSRSEACGDILVHHWVYSCSSPLNLFTVLWLEYWTWVQNRSTKLLEPVKPFSWMWKLSKQEWHQASEFENKPLLADKKNPNYFLVFFFFWDCFSSWKKAHIFFRYVFT